MEVSLAALNDPHYKVRESAIDVLDELCVAGRYLDRIRPFLADSHEDVRAAARWATKAAVDLAGETDDLDVDGNKTDEE